MHASQQNFIEAAAVDAIPGAPVAVMLTEKAAEMVKQAMAEEQLVDHSLRVGVIGGGCSGLQYLLDFSQATADLDTVDEQHGVRVCIDPFSAAHLYNAEEGQPTTIDYVDGLHGSGFKFENPNIVRSCGCGSSFQT